MPEPIAAWWARRQQSRGSAVPYAVGAYRESWQSFPVLVRQYHPEFNGGIVLSQIPPAADVFLCWQCDVGHVFVATPSEQRMRPGRERRRSAWCPECAEQAAPTRRPPAVPMRPGRLAETGTGWLETAPTLERRPLRPDRRTPAQGSAGARGAAAAQDPAPAQGSAAAQRPAQAQRRTVAQGPTSARRPTAAGARVCAKTPDLPAGEAFASVCAPPPASAVEAELRAGLTSRLEFTAGVNAVRLARPFFDHLEAWPDILLPELRVAIEYDSTGRHGLEHVGRREATDRRKDRVLRGAGWEVIRIRAGRLPALGPHDLLVSGLARSTYSRLLDELRAIRGPLLVDAYLR